jgi:hypothetical protein
MANDLEKRDKVYLTEIRDEQQRYLLDKMKTECLSSGKYADGQISVSPKIMSSVIAAAGATLTSISSEFSGKLFMATANPDMLMRVGSGITAAVRGAQGRIVSVAPFVPVAGALPVVAPLMAMQALTTVAMLQQLGAIDKKLDTIKETIDKLLIRQEATVVGELLSAVKLVDEIYDQYDTARCFSVDMLIRLAFAEHDASRLFARYSILNSIGGNAVSATATNSDTYLMVLASFLNLRIKYLRTCVDVQENPLFAQKSSDSLREMLGDNLSLWDGLLRRPSELHAEIETVEHGLEDGNKLLNMARKMSSDKDLTRLKGEYASALAMVNNIQTDFYQLIAGVKETLQIGSDNQASPLLLYWDDEQGEHCFATNEEELLRSA